MINSKSLQNIFLEILGHTLLFLALIVSPEYFPLKFLMSHFFYFILALQPRDFFQND